MLTKLVKKMIDLDNKELDKHLFVEGVTLQSNMDIVKRYSLIDEECENTAAMPQAQCPTCMTVDTLSTILSSIKFEDTDTEDDKKEKLLNSLRSVPLNELHEGAVSVNKEKKLISMLKEDYEKMKEIVAAYKKDHSNMDAKKKIRKFISEVLNKMQSTKLETDTFINAIIDAIYRSVNDGSSTVPSKNDPKYPNGKDFESLDEEIIYKIQFITVNL